MLDMKSYLIGMAAGAVATAGGIFLMAWVKVDCETSVIADCIENWLPMAQLP